MVTGSVGSWRGQVPSLGAMCLALLLRHVDAVESLGYVTSQVRYQFADALAKHGKLNAENVMRVVDPGLVELYLPDCKLLEEVELTAAIKRAAEHDDPMETEPCLRILRLGWCGRGFGSRAASAILDCGLGKSLEALELSGLFKVPDAALIKLLGSISGLTTLEMPFKSHFSASLAQAVTSIKTLTSLSLAQCAQVGLTRRQI
jgi:hypothetical protein